ncbi:MAG: hypothetical protein AAFR76_05815 [Planctomycetota bacterium]
METATMNATETSMHNDAHADARTEARTEALVASIAVTPAPTAGRVIAKRCCGRCATCPRRLLAEAPSFAPPAADEGAGEPVGVVVTLRGLAAPSTHRAAALAA